VTPGRAPSPTKTPPAGGLGLGPARPAKPDGPSPQTLRAGGIGHHLHGAHEQPQLSRSSPGVRPRGTTPTDPVGRRPDRRALRGHETGAPRATAPARGFGSDGGVRRTTAKSSAPHAAARAAPRKGIHQRSSTSGFRPEARSAAEEGATARRDHPDPAIAALPARALAGQSGQVTVSATTGGVGEHLVVNRAEDPARPHPFEQVDPDRRFELELPWRRRRGLRRDAAARRTSAEDAARPGRELRQPSSREGRIDVHRPTVCSAFLNCSRRSFRSGHRGVRDGRRARSPSRGIGRVAGLADAARPS